MWNTVLLSAFCLVALSMPNAAGFWKEGMPPEEMPDELRSEFTLGGRVPVKKYYVDDSNGGEGTHYQFIEEDLDTMIGIAKKSAKKLQGSKRARPDDKLRWIYWALEDHSIKGLDVVVFGSMEPYYESICIAYGAKSVTTIDYNRLSFAHPKMQTLTVEELKERSIAAKARGETLFQAALSISSFDHDGLGRYGDPVSPNGDIEAMELVKDVLSPDGLFFFSVPVGEDVVVWNLHRRYGEIRLPLMLKGWRVVERYGWEDSRLTAPASYTRSYEPLHVLSPVAGEPAESIIKPAEPNVKPSPVESLVEEESVDTELADEL